MDDLTANRIKQLKKKLEMGHTMVSCLQSHIFLMLTGNLSCCQVLSGSEKHLDFYSSHFLFMPLTFQVSKERFASLLVG